MSTSLHPETEYYEYLPEPQLNSGDILEFQPGLKIPLETNKYVVVSPSCDLLQQKADSVVLLPIIPLGSYFFRPHMFQQEILKKVKKNLPEARQENLPIQIWGFREYVEGFLSEVSAPQREKLKSLLEWLGRLSHNRLASADFGLVERCIGRTDLETKMREIINDAYRTDAFFLPPTKQEKNDRIQLKDGGVVLLRNQLSVPFELLCIALDSDSSWSGVVSSGHFEAKDFFADCPIKVGRMKGPFYSDLSSRFLAYQIRSGSPDFADHYVELLVQKSMPRSEK